MIFETAKALEVIFGLLCGAALLWSFAGTVRKLARVFYRALIGELDGPPMSWREFYQLIALCLLVAACAFCLR